MDLHSRWLATWQALGTTADEGLFAKLIASYSEPHRRYHTVRHLEECFEKLDEIRFLAEHPAEVELALWFHDAVYDPRRHDNEARSAEWVKSVLSANDPVAAERVYGLVMATRHYTSGHYTSAHGTDAKVVADVDLSIVAAEPQRFNEYQAQIREEYSERGHLI